MSIMLGEIMLDILKNLMVSKYWDIEDPEVCSLDTNVSSLM